MAAKKDDIAIRVNNVSKVFKLPHQKQSSLKGMFLNSFRRKTYEVQEALKDVSFDIKKGEFFGIVGRNGSGKSTLLKCMAGVYSPTEGSIEISGSLVPFIELGVGFNPELSGRDNVFLNGALLGFSRKQMEDMYDDIVEFAELERFMDQKLNNYSSGMQVRLAFSIAIRAESDILLLDEVLAVGDESFQRKCIDIFEKYKSGNRTIVLVTHNMAMVEQYCDRAILIDDGKLKNEGDPRKIATEYLMLNKNKHTVDEDFSDVAFSKKHGASYKITNLNNHKSIHEFNFGDAVEIKVKWKSDEIKNIGIALIKNSGEYIYGTNTMVDNIKVTKEVTYRLDLNLSRGSYHFLIGFYGDTAHERVHLIEKGLTININNTDQEWSGLIKLKNDWIC